MPRIRQDFEIPYDEIKGSFYPDVQSNNITRLFIVCYAYCKQRLSNLPMIDLINSTSIHNKAYFVFNNNGNYSRPVNKDLYQDGLSLDSNGADKVTIFWQNLQNHTITNQSANDITSAVYVISISFCCCTELFSNSGIKQAGTFFEKFIGHLYSIQFGINPSTAMTTNILDGQSVSIPTDFIFDMGIQKPKFHIPVKTSTRERVVQVWAQQRVLDGAYGVGRFYCLLTCIGETELIKKNHSLSVNEVCVPGQWQIYQLYIAQLKRVYYLDMPEKYSELNNMFPKIHHKLQ